MYRDLRRIAGGAALNYLAKTAGDIGDHVISVWSGRKGAQTTNRRGYSIRSVIRGQERRGYGRTERRNYRTGYGMPGYTRSTWKQRGAAYKRAAYHKRKWQKRRRTRPGGLSYLNSGGGGGGTKFFDSALAATTIANTWAGSEVDPTTILCLSAAPQGTTGTTRLGRNMYIHAVYVRGALTISSKESSAFPPPYLISVRLVLVWDMHTNGAQLNGEDVFEASSANILNFRNLENTGRFKILYDRTINLSLLQSNEGAVNVFASGSITRLFRINKTFPKPIPVRFTIGTTTGIIGNVQDNSVHLLAVTNDNVAGPKIEYVCRIRFSDGGS